MAVINQTSPTSDVAYRLRGSIVLIAQDEGLLGELRAALHARLPDAGEILIPGYEPVSAIVERIQESKAGIAGFVVGMSDPEKGVALIRDLGDEFNGAPIAAAADHGSADLILQCMRAGAAEFLSPPFDIDQLAKSFAAWRTEEEKQAEAGRLFAIMPAQGGNGASTVSLHVANDVARLTKKRTLLVDYDFHSGTIAFRVRLRPEYSLTDALARADNLDELWDKIAARWKDLDILTPPDDKVAPGKIDLRSTPALFDSALRKYANVFVDMPAALFSSSREILTQCEAVCVVCTPEVTSLHLARRRVGELIDVGVPREAMRLVVNRVGSTRALDKDDVESVVGMKVHYTIRNDYDSLADAHLRGGLVGQDSKLGKQFTELACALAGIETAKPAPGRRKGLRSFWSLG